MCKTLSLNLVIERGLKVDSFSFSMLWKPMFIKWDGQGEYLWKDQIENGMDDSKRKEESR
jgi:hypothetical protein